MASFNHVVIVGNLTADPELRYIPSGTAVCDFTVAVNRKWTDKGGETKEEVSFLDCVVWAKGAEIFAQYMKKGRPVLVSGSLKQERWEDDKTGQKRSRVRINVDTFQFLGGKKDGETEDAPKRETADEPF